MPLRTIPKGRNTAYGTILSRSQGIPPYAFSFPSVLVDIDVVLVFADGVMMLADPKPGIVLTIERDVTIGVPANAFVVPSAIADKRIPLIRTGSVMMIAQRGVIQSIYGNSS